MISFTGKTMLTAGIKKSAKASFFKGDTPSEVGIDFDKKIMSALDDVSRTAFIKEDYPISNSARKVVKEVKNPSVESYVAAHQNITEGSNSLSFDSSVKGENIQIFG